MSLINITNLTFSYEGSYDNIFENVSFQIDTDWKLGFIGRNGRGKTTFLNLLLGKYEFSGKITTSVDFEYFPFVVEDKTQNTLDVVYSINESIKLWELIKELSLLELEDEVLYRPFNTLSGGEQTKVLLASLFLKENNFLLVDEPTNHLDMEARRAVAKYLNGKKKFILVSHDRMLLDSCVDHILSINKTNIEIQSGNFSSWYYNKQLQDSFEIEKNKNLKKEIKRLEITAAEKASWSNKVEATKIGTHQGDRGWVGHKSAKMMKRSKSIEARLNNEMEEKSKLLKNIEASEKLAIKPISYHSERMVEFKNVAINYGDNMICSGLSFTVNSGERIVLTGRNGSGKSSVLKLITGEDISHTGDIWLGSNLIISYVSQDTSHLNGDLKEYAAVHNLDESLFKAILRKLDFARVQFDKDIKDLSSGQKKKVLVAKSLCEKAHLYIWDEPLNFIDVISRIQIEDLILEHKPTMLFVEHDFVFSEKIATKQIKI